MVLLLIHILDLIRLVLIQKIRISRGSQELENLDNYNALLGQTIAMQQSTDSSCGKLNVLAGTSQAMFANTTTKEVTTAIIGERLNPYAANLTAAGTTATQTYSITLMSLVGSLSNQYLPFFEMTSPSLTIEIQLVDSILIY